MPYSGAMERDREAHRFVALPVRHSEFSEVEPGLAAVVASPSPRYPDCEVLGRSPLDLGLSGEPSLELPLTAAILNVDSLKLCLAEWMVIGLNIRLE
jgi:hypothetical protein